MRHKLEAVVAHDSYLINLASPDPVLRARSIESFRKELERSRTLGLRAVVSHPGNYMDEREPGLERNARGYAECLVAVPGDLEVWIEGTAGSGTALGATFEELRDLRDALPDAIRTRVGFCLDTAHLHAVGYDLSRVELVWEEFDRVIGFRLLKCLHLNDSRAAAASRVDRHEWIGEGKIGPEPFRCIMRDPNLSEVVKIIETPKRDDPLRHDRRMLRRLRAYARGRRSTHRPRSSTSPVPLLTHSIRSACGGAIGVSHTQEREFNNETHVVRADAGGGVLRRPGSQPATDAAPDGFAGGAGPAAARQAGQLTSGLGPAACGTRSRSRAGRRRSRGIARRGESGRGWWCTRYGSSRHVGTGDGAGAQSGSAQS